MQRFWVHMMLQPWVTNHHTTYHLRWSNLATYNAVLNHLIRGNNCMSICITAYACCISVGQEKPHIGHWPFMFNSKHEIHYILGFASQTCRGQAKDTHEVCSCSCQAKILHVTTIQDNVHEVLYNEVHQRS